MDFLKNFDWSAKSFAKIFWIIIWWIIVFTIVISLISLSIKTISTWGRSFENNNLGQPYMEKSMMAMPRGMSSDMALNSDDIREEYWETSDLTDEDFEIKEYSTNIKTLKKEETCNSFSSLKEKSYIIFETSNNSEVSCNFRFKVEKDKDVAIVALIEKYKPEYFNLNIQTIKRRVDNMDSEITILTKNLESIEQTLLDAQSAYDELTILATKKEDTESLAKIIDSKLNLIKTLTNERQNVRSQISRLSRDKDIQLERLKYSFFNVSIYENLIVDWKEIKKSWENQIKSFVKDLNSIAQDITVNLVNYVLRFIQVTIYFFISLFILKFVWYITRKIWKSGKS